MDVVADGDLLVVREGARIPKLCVKCGAYEDVERREQAFAIGQQSAGIGAAGGAAGAVVASVLRNALRGQPWTQAAVVLGLLVVVGGAVGVAHSLTGKIYLDVPLCGAHAARLDAARRQRAALLVTLAVAGVLVILGIGLESVATMVIALSIFALAIGVAFAIGLPKAWIKARWARDGAVALDVGAALAARIAKRAEKRARKQREAAA